MALRPDDAANLAKSVREIFVEGENLILSRIAAAVAKGLDSPDWAEQKLAGLQTLLAEIDQIITDLANNVPGATEKALQFAYNRGIAAMSAEIAQTGIGAAAFAEIQPSSGLAALIVSTVASQPEQFFQIRRAASDMYQQVITRTTAQVTLGVLTRREASRAALLELAKGGVTSFRDRSGRRWDMGTYNEMAVRSSSMNAMLQGSMDRMKEFGHDLVIVSDAPEECKLCRPFEGRVLSLAGESRGKKLSDGVSVYGTLSAAKSAGLFHNNCRHSFSLYLPGVTKREPAKPDPEGNKLREQQRAFERRIRELKRLDSIEQELGGPGAVTARAKLRAKQSEFKDWREANGRKDLSYRTNITSR